MTLAPAKLIQADSELLEKIRKEIHEDPNTRGQDLETIKDWLRKQPHLPDQWEESCMLNFLRGCSFSMEKCKKKLDMYFTMRAACPEFFTNRDIGRPELLDLMTRAQNPTMPNLTPEGRRVVVCRGLTKKLESYQLVDWYRLLLMIADIRLLEESEGIAGHVYIFDADIVQPSHLGTISLAELKKFLVCIQEAYPLKLKQVHIVNASKLIDLLYNNFAKPFLKEKIRNRVFFHKDYTGLHEYIPKDVLPTEYGGTSCSLEEVTRAWVVKLQEYSEWFKEQESLKANEALRPGEPKNYDELFGIDGSFRQLTVD